MSNAENVIGSQGSSGQQFVAPAINPYHSIGTVGALPVARSALFSAEKLVPALLGILITLIGVIYFNLKGDIDDLKGIQKKL
jgi:hypothetical protein